MKGLPLVFFLAGVALVAPHLSQREAEKYSIACILAGIVLWGIEIVIS